MTYVEIAVVVHNSNVSKYRFKLCKIMRLFHF